jgi:hypothetical protein
MRIVFLLVAGCATPHAKPFVECRLSLDETVVQPRQSVRATIALTNRAATPLVIARRIEAENAEWIVDGANRKRRRETAIQRLTAAPAYWVPPGPDERVALGRGESWTATVDIVDSARTDTPFSINGVPVDDAATLRTILDTPGRHVLELELASYEGDAPWRARCNRVEVTVSRETI